MEHSAEPPIPPITQIVAEFVYHTNYQQLDHTVIATVKNLLLDYIGVASAATQKAESTGPVFEAISKLNGRGGSHTVIASGQTFTAQYAALLNGLLAHSLDFDDTFAPGALHAGTTTISAGLVAAEDSSSSTETLLAALAVGYEVTCRLGRALTQAAYSRGFHNTATAGIFGAVATIAKIKGLSVPLIEMAFGLAGSKAAGSMQYLENGSWNKRLHPGFTVHDAWMCVELAQAGVIGAAKILEGKFGFFNAYTPATVDYDKLRQGLGTEWVFLETIWKPFPACRMTHGLITMVDDLRAPDRWTNEVKSITVQLPAYQIPIVGASTPNKVHPQNIVDAQFSAYYQVSLAWLHGGHTGWAGYDRLHDEDIHALADRITIVPGENLSAYQQRIKIEFGDGSTVEKDIEPGLEDRADESAREQVIAKYLGLASDIYGEERAKQIQETVYSLEARHVQTLMDLIQ
ncbi:uncharacterized protein N7459_003740 [Penicillium hispanicum]|uniref:uncharacterized protein n=1 Tax=Penicillium hispanicum TaxID=1080232 RepID=UPI002540C78A|nr:uncharacterized protein N7459_003740 [Penicillium hispanicum]KAJ5587975.1 hypothetical protein N7459_003740 [Penicillium hispanicum]